MSVQKFIKILEENFNPYDEIVIETPDSKECFGTFTLKTKRIQDITSKVDYNYAVLQPHIYGSIDTIDIEDAYTIDGLLDKIDSQKEDYNQLWNSHIKYMEYLEKICKIVQGVEGEPITYHDLITPEDAIKEIRKLKQQKM